MGRERALLLALTLVACDRAPAKESPAAPPVVEPATAAPTKIVVPTEAAPIVPTAPAPKEIAPTIGSPAAATTGAVPATAPGVAKVKPARKGAPSPPPPAEEPPVPPPAPAPVATPFTPKTLVAEKLFRIELAPLAPCKPATTCEARLLVHSLGGYKVNSEYPTKFVAKDSAAVTVEGTGTFAVTDKTIGTMIVKFRATAAGTAPVAGVLKLSVCTDDICEIAAPAIAFDVPVNVTAPR